MPTVRPVKLLDEEDAALRELVLELDYSAAGIMRVALRCLVGLPVPPWARELRDRQRGKVAA